MRCRSLPLLIAFVALLPASGCDPDLMVPGANARARIVRTSSETGADALASRVAELRRIARAPQLHARYHFGTTAKRSATVFDLLSELERSRHVSTRGAAGPRKSMDWATVTGGSYIYGSGGTGTRTVEYNAYTQCNGCWDTDRPGGEMHIQQVATGGVVTVNTTYGFSGIGSYASGYAQTMISGDPQTAYLTTKHTAEVYFRTDPAPYFSSASGRV